MVFHFKSKNIKIREEFKKKKIKLTQKTKKKSNIRLSSFVPY